MNIIAWLVCIDKLSSSNCKSKPDPVSLSLAFITACHSNNPLPIEFYAFFTAFLYFCLHFYFVEFWAKLTSRYHHWCHYSWIPCKNRSHIIAAWNASRLGQYGNNWLRCNIRYPTRTNKIQISPKKANPGRLIWVIKDFKIEVEDGTWTFEREFFKKLLISNVCLPKGNAFSRSFI